jgi:hypothetical protein
MKKKIIYLIIIGLACSMSFYALISIKSNDTDKGFIRKITTDNAKLQRTFQFPSASIIFAWNPDDYVWVVDYKNPLTLLKFGFSLNKIEQVELKKPKDYINTNRAYFDRLDSNIYFTNLRGDLAVGYKGRTKNYKIHNLNFDAFSCISSNTIIVRNFKRNKGNNSTELSKLTLEQSKPILKNYTLPKQLDGIFCSDGQLYYDKPSSKLFYMFFHRGEFLCLDTNLNLLFKTKTIDTVHKANIKLGSYSQKQPGGKIKVVTSIKAPAPINRYFTISEDHIYILSGLKADNQDKTFSLKNESIDVYSIENGSYLYSFTLPKLQGYRVSEFKVKGNIIIATYRNYLVTFKVEHIL